MNKRSFGEIDRLPSKRYRVRYTGPDTQRHKAPQTFRTRMDAEAWLVTERHLVDTGTWTAPARRAEEAERAEAARLANTFGLYARAYLDGRHDLRATTRASYTTALHKHLLPMFGDLPLDLITTAMVRKWFGSYGEKTPTARAHAYALLRTILAQAEDDRIIDRNPARIRAGGRTRVQREPEVLTLGELLSLADAMPEQHRALTLLCGFCGLRFGEAVALRRRDVDLKDAVIRVRRGATRAGGKKIVGEPKTAAAVRDVHMPTIVVEAMRAHLGDTISGGRDGLVFPGRDGELLAPTALYGNSPRTEKRGGRTYEKKGYGFHAAREAIGKPELHWHDLRRTAATLGAQSGATVREMQHRLGHTTPAMALYYQGATAERDKAIADRLQAAVEQARASHS